MKKLGFDYRFGADLPTREQDDWQRKSNGYRVTFTYDRRKQSFDFWQGSAITNDPAASDVMACLISDAHAGEESFDDFCADMGLDNDSRSAEATWKACQRVGSQLARLFGADYRAAMDTDWEELR